MLPAVSWSLDFRLVFSELFSSSDEEASLRLWRVNTGNAKDFFELTLWEVLLE